MGYKDIPVVELKLEEYLKKKLLINDIKTFGKLLDLYLSNELLLLPGLGQVKYNKIASFIEEFIRNTKDTDEAVEYENIYNKELVFKKDLPVEKYPFSERVKNRVKTMKITYLSEIENTIYKSYVNGIGRASKEELLEAYEWQKKNHSKYFDKEIVPKAKKIREVVLESLKITFNRDFSEEQWHDVSCYLLYKICQRLEANVTIEIEDLINDCLNDWEILIYYVKNVFNANPLKTITSEYVLQNSNHLISKNAVDNCLNKMCSEGIIKEVENDSFKLQLHSFFEIYSYVKKTSNIDKKEVIRLRLEEGLTLVEVGQIYGLTRERIRQIICKEKKTFLEIIEAQTGQTCFQEDRYAYIFSTYSISKEDFIEIFDIANKEYYYLESIYSKGNEKLVSALYDEEVPTRFKKRIIKCIQGDTIILNGDLIPARKSEIVNYVLRKYCRDSIDMDSFINLYNKVLREHNIYNENLYIVDEGYKRTLKNKICLIDKCLSSGKTFRYYDIYLYDYSDLLETIDLLSYDGLMISTHKFIENYPHIMELYDIRNEYELHNLLKKILSNNENYSRVAFSRMPHIIVGNFNIDEYLKQKLFEYSPISADELVDIIYEETGIDKPLIRVYFNRISNYFAKGVFEIPYDVIDYPNVIKLQNSMTEELYLLDEFYKLYDKVLPDFDRKYITRYLYNQLGYRLCSGYIIKKQLTAEEYFKSLLQKEGIYDISNIRKKYAYIQVFYQALFDLTVDYLIVEIDPNIYCKIDELENKGWNKNKIIDFVNKILKKVDDGEYFTYSYLIDKGVVFEEDFSQTFYEGIIKANPQVSFMKMQNKLVLCKNKKEITAATLVEYLLNEHERLSLDRINYLLMEKYGVSVDRYKLSQIVNNGRMHYDVIEGIAYKDHYTYKKYN